MRKKYNTMKRCRKQSKQLQTTATSRSLRKFIKSKVFSKSCILYLLTNNFKLLHDGDILDSEDKKKLAVSLDDYKSKHANLDVADEQKYQLFELCCIETLLGFIIKKHLERQRTRFCQPQWIYNRLLGTKKEDFICRFDRIYPQLQDKKILINKVLDNKAEASIVYNRFNQIKFFIYVVNYLLMVIAFYARSLTIRGFSPPTCIAIDNSVAIYSQQYDCDDISYIPLSWGEIFSCYALIMIMSFIPNRLIEKHILEKIATTIKQLINYFSLETLFQSRDHIIYGFISSTCAIFQIAFFNDTLNNVPVNYQQFLISNNSWLERLVAHIGFGQALLEMLLKLLSYYWIGAQCIDGLTRATANFNIRFMIIATVLFLLGQLLSCFRPDSESSYIASLQIRYFYFFSGVTTALWQGVFDIILKLLGERSTFSPENFLSINFSQFNLDFIATYQLTRQENARTLANNNNANESISSIKWTFNFVGKKDQIKRVKRKKVATNPAYISDNESKENPISDVGYPYRAIAQSLSRQLNINENLIYFISLVNTQNTDQIKLEKVWCIILDFTKMQSNKDIKKCNGVKEELTPALGSKILSAYSSAKNLYGAGIWVAKTTVKNKKFNQKIKPPKSHKHAIYFNDGNKRPVIFNHDGNSLQVNVIHPEHLYLDIGDHLQHTNF